MLEMLIIFGEYLLFCLFLRNSALNAIDDIKINFKLFSRHYSMPSRGLRKIFRLKKREIPKFLIFRLYVSLIFGILTPISSVIALILSFNEDIISIIIIFPLGYMLLDLILFLVMYHIFRR